MPDQFARTRLLIGDEGIEKLARSRVAVFGIGGVGGYAVEALARSGVGELHLIDNDRVSLSNLNRQIIATHSTLGKYKVDAARERVLDINPNARVYTYRTFLTPETAGEFDFSGFDYVVDAIDTVAGKLALAVETTRAGVPEISSMGAGNKLDPTAFEVGDIFDTSFDPLARVMRKELKKRGIGRMKVVWSREQPMVPPARADVAVSDSGTEEGGAAPRRPVPASNAFVPPVAGLIIAGEVVKDITGFSAKSQFGLVFPDKSTKNINQHE